MMKLDFHPSQESSGLAGSVRNNHDSDAFIRTLSQLNINNNNIFVLIFNLTYDKPQNDYKYSLNRWLQVITEFEFNCTATIQGAHHVIPI